MLFTNNYEDPDFLPDVTRFEVIDEKGRSYTTYDVKEIHLSLQDNGKTLKLFISKELKNG